MKAEVYGTPTCKYCKSAKSLLELNDIEYSYTDISDGEERTNLELRMKSSVRSVPQIFVDNRYVGGFEELKRFVSTI